MITKEKFVHVMKQLTVLNDKIENLDSALKVISPDFGGFFFPDYEVLIMNMLKDDLKDVDDWLGYLVYECDYLREYEEGLAIDEDNKPLDFSSWDQVYDFLTKGKS